MAQASRVGGGEGRPLWDVQMGLALERAPPWVETPVWLRGKLNGNPAFFCCAPLSHKIEGSPRWQVKGKHPHLLVAVGYELGVQVLTCSHRTTLPVHLHFCWRKIHVSPEALGSLVRNTYKLPPHQQKQEKTRTRRIGDSLLVLGVSSRNRVLV